jgi:ubiquinone biosynthesis protein
MVSLKTEHLKRYKDLTLLLVKYGRSDLVKHASWAEGIEYDESLTREAAPEAEELAADLEKLGPTFIKLGQLLSTRADLLPQPYLDALSRLQDQVEPVEFEEVERIVSSELSVRISKAFVEFERKPIATASLAQVHRAQLRDGTLVAVKVQRPNIREVIVEDLDALGEIARFLDLHTELGKRYEFENMLADLRRSLLRELDFKLEANNLNTIAANLYEFDRIVLPEPIEDFTTSRVLTMTFIPGKKITSLSPLRLIEIDATELANQIFRAYLKQMLVDGLFHADPHPGNVLLTEENEIALIDLGMVAILLPAFRDKLLRLLLAISEGHGERAAEISIAMGEPKPNFNKEEFNHRVGELVAEHASTTLGKIDAGKVVMEIQKIAADCWFRLPTEFTMIAKALLNLDRVVFTLDSDFDPNAVIRKQSYEVLERNILKTVAPANLMSVMVEAKEFLEKIPSRINKILDTVGDNKLRLKVDAIDEKVVLEGLQKVANRITLGLILAALIVGAAMLMRVDTSFRILGYPGFPLIFFLIAAVAGVGLVITIVRSDVKANDEKRK